MGKRRRCMSGKRSYLGEFEKIVLLALVRLGDKAYGNAIRRTVEERIGRAPSVGALYTTLERLEDKGMVSSFWGEATPERGGRPKRYFRLEAPGIQALEESRQMHERMWQGVELGLQALVCKVLGRL